MLNTPQIWSLVGYLQSRKSETKLLFYYSTITVQKAEVIAPSYFVEMTWVHNQINSDVLWKGLKDTLMLQKHHWHKPLADPSSVAWKDLCRHTTTQRQRVKWLWSARPSWILLTFVLHYHLENCTLFQLQSWRVFTSYFLKNTLFSCLKFCVHVIISLTHWWSCWSVVGGTHRHKDTPPSPHPHGGHAHGSSCSQPSIMSH